MERRTTPGDSRVASGGSQVGPRLLPTRDLPRAASQNGFTLAGLIVVLTIMMIFVAYTVPQAWSTAMQRDRELQTIFIMKQYAKAIHEFSRKNNNTFPVSMQQLKDAKLPRYIRAKDGEYLDPLTNEVDWMIIPASAAGATGQPVVPGPVGPAPTTGTAPVTGTTGTTGTDNNLNPGQPVVPAVPMKDYAGGPFIGVRPGKTGKAFLQFNGMENYEQWSYTVNDYRAEMNARIAAASKQWQ